jgi:hypothetical protein
MKIRKANMDKKYEGMIKEVASDIVFDLQESALQCAWTATAIPIEFWEQTVSEAVKEVVKDILQDKKANEETDDTGFWQRFATWRKRNLGGY